GIEWQKGTPEVKKVVDFLQNEMDVKNIRFPETSGIGVKPVSEEGTKRLVRSSIEYALNEGRRNVTLVHNAKIMKITEDAIEEYDRIVEKDGKDAANKAEDEAVKAGKIVVKDAIADIFLQQILTRPNEFDVVATMNLNGDYISDALAAQVGGIGIAPGANINY